MRAVKGKSAAPVMPFSVTRSSGSTLIEQVEEGLRSAIERGAYKPGDTLPTTREMARSLGVGRIVVERALARLKNRNYVSARPHVGIVVVASGVKVWRGSVLIVSTSHSGSYYPNVFTAEVKSRLLAAGYFCLQVSAESFSPGEADLSALKVYLRGQVDLAVELFNTTAVEKCLSDSGVPFFAVGSKRCGRRGCCGNVRLDWNLAAREFAVHCRASGVRRVLQVRTRQRMMADVRAVLSDVGIACEDLVVKVPENSRRPEGVAAQAYKTMCRRLKRVLEKREDLPDLIFFSDDHLAKGALWALAEAGVGVPEAVKVVAWANRGDAPAYRVPLTMMEMDPKAHGAVVAERLVAWLERRKPAKDEALGPDYRLGQTFR